MSTDNISPDIFYKVKKQILDKLDIILQKVNLEIIDARPHSQQFTFIELSHFEVEISTLFIYLDKLYDSLNASASEFSSSKSKSSICSLQEENICLHQKVQELELANANLKNTHKQFIIRVEMVQKEFERERKKNEHWLIEKNQVTSKLKEIRAALAKESELIKTAQKWIRAKLKEHKFQVLETRIQILSHLKQFEVSLAEKNQRVSLIQSTKQSDCTHCGDEDFYQSDIMIQLDEMLNMC